jgi:hypothetical protein
MRAIAEVSEPAVILAQPIAVPDEIGVQNSEIPNKRESSDGAPASAAPEMRCGARHVNSKPGPRPNRKGLGDAERAPQPRVAKRRTRALLRKQLKHGPRPGAQIEAAAQAADIPKPVLLAVTDELGVRIKRGEWRLSDHRVPPSRQGKEHRQESR